MAVYLALLDENPADRKQAERLLYRESSYRSDIGETLYFDTFGSEELFLPFMEKYDLALIDVHEKRDGMMVVADMMKKGCDFPVYLCSGEIDYKKKYGCDERYMFDNLHYLYKPLKASDYRELIDTALDHKKNKPRKVELRSTSETLYVRPEEIIYALLNKDSLSVALTDGRSVHLPCSMDEFIDTIGIDAPGFMSISEKAVINMDEVVSVSGNAFKMTNGAVIKFSIFSRHRILKIWKNRIRK